MAGDMTAGRFIGDPQPVEIHHQGIWYSGELLGWRQTPGGRVAARVRCTVDGLRHSTWKDLAELRLPDPAHPPRREPFPAAPTRQRDADPVDGSPVPDTERTRPHALLAAMSARPRPPAHAVSPPATPGSPAAVPPPLARPHRASAPDGPRPTPYRRADEWSRDWPDARSPRQRLSSV